MLVKQIGTRSVRASSCGIIRSYAALAYQNKNTLNGNNDNNSNYTTPIKSSLNLVKGLSFGKSWLTPTPTEPPHIQILNEGSGAIALANIPAGAHVIARVDAPLAFSSSLNSDLQLLAKNILVRKFFLSDIAITESNQTSQNNVDNITSAELILSPKKLGDIALLELDGSREYLIKRSAYFGHTSGVTIDNTLRDPQEGVGSFTNLLSKGTGNVIITSYGGLTRLILSPNEDYIVDSSQILTWESSTKFEPLHSSESNQSFQTAQPSIWRRIGSLVASPFKSIYSGTVKIILGEREFIKVKGPADIWLSTRERPTVEYKLSIPKVEFHKNSVEKLSKEVSTALSSIPLATKELSNKTKNNIVAQFTGFTDASVQSAKSMIAGKLPKVGGTSPKVDESPISNPKESSDVKTKTAAEAGSKEADK